MAITGLANVQKMLRDKVKTYRNGVRDVVRDTGRGVEFDAKMNAPPMIDGLINGEIVSDKNGYGYSVKVNAMPGSGMMRNMPVYLEFGTGLYAASYVPTLPKEWQDAARKYFINGKGTTKVHSFLNPAWVKNTSPFVYRVREVLRKG
ncbi:hypothetical protein ORI89_07515 [Sphingobacterium sp. UT-1RO-CII-1]|uniref:hypothetical protein n=1 Tax=Sphingobacterium sp. UT-1RO-CII-1 TaxID=2995225 RepID=UPI00227B762B|nr:hypothetical protein [Sphingobacterium sp. UT-1RO-CII-1]MCY4779493.1 hypothetical protein [Sphingobacterium sp. UT-1RO-CII-1]